MTSVRHQGMVLTEFRQREIMFLFFTSVYSVCGTELANIPQNYSEFSVAEFRIVPRNFAKFWFPE
jgi:hypothetical protein